MGSSRAGAPTGRDVDRVYLDGVIGRSTAFLHLLVDGMNATRTTEVQYFIQQAAPVVLRELDRAKALRKTL